LSDYDVGDYGVGYLRSGSGGGERGKGRCGYLIWSVDGIDVVGGEMGRTAWGEEEGVCLRRDWTWPREKAGLEGGLRVVK